MEKLGFPPIDVAYALKTLKGIEAESYTRYGNEYVFYFYASMKKSKRWNKVRQDVIKKKLQLITDYVRRYLNKKKKGIINENITQDAIIFDCKKLLHLIETHTDLLERKT